MNVGFYTSVSGMMAYQQNMDTIAHNMANIQTVGYKALQSSFSDALYTEMDTNVEGNFLMGHGVKNNGTQLLYGQGFLKQTDRQLDFALAGNGFFAVERDGQVQYTRNGSFSLSMENGQPYLITNDGGYVLDGNGQRIQLEPQPGTNVPNFNTLTDRIGVYSFTNPHGLQPAENGSFTMTAVSGQPALAVNNGLNATYKLVQGSIENSGVDMAQEMSNVISAQKAFQFNAKMVQTADQIEEMINNLR